DAKVREEFVDEMLNKEPNIQKHQDEVARLKNLIEEHKRKSLLPESKDLTLQTYLRSKQAAENALVEARKRMTPEVTDKARIARSAEVANSVRQLQAQLEMHKANEQEQSKQEADLGVAITTMTKNSLQWDVNQDELTVLEGLTKYITDQEAQLRIELNDEAKKNAADVIEDTAIIRANEETRLILMTSAAAAGALLLVVLAFAFWEFRARRVGAADDVSHGLGMKLMGTLPDSSARAYGARTNGGGASGHSLLAEAVDATRTILLRAARTEGLRVVMVTSAHTGGGKTALSTPPAASLGQGR